MSLMTRSAARKAMLRPKPEPQDRKFFLPPVGDWRFTSFLGRLMPAERMALQTIVEHADLIMPDGAPPHLLILATPDLLQTLAAFEADAEDREDDLCDEPNGDLEDDRANDDAHDRYQGVGGAWPYEDQEDDGRAPPGATKSREAFIVRRKGTLQRWLADRKLPEIKKAIEKLFPSRRLPAAQRYRDIF